MNERIIEIILYLITRLQKNSEIRQTDFARLTDDGYSEAEIGAAFSWIAGREVLGVAQPQPAASKSFRVLHEMERRLFRTEAWGYVLQLVGIGLISSAQVEAVIEHARMIAFESLMVEDVKQIVANLLMESGDPNIMSAQAMLRAGDTVH